jgi:hypothetical protein
VQANTWLLLLLLLLVLLLLLLLLLFLFHSLCSIPSIRRRDLADELVTGVVPFRDEHFMDR